MRKLLLALLLVAPGCSLYFGGSEPEPIPEPQPQPQVPHFEITRTMAGEATIVGMDVDHEGGVWVAYSREVGGFYVNDEVRVVHLDETGAKVAEFAFDDEYTNVTGLAFSGDALWLNYNDQVSNNHIRKIDPVTGATLANIGTEAGIVDLDVYGDELRLSKLWNEVIALDLSTGAQKWRAGFEDADFFYSTQRGIASDANGRVWVTSWNSEDLFLFDRASGIVGKATSEASHQTVASGQQMFLASDGDDLVIALDAQIFWLRQTPQVL